MNESDTDNQRANPPKKAILETPAILRDVKNYGTILVYCPGLLRNH